MIQVRPIIQLNKTCYFKQESALFIAFFGCGLFSFCPQISSWCTIGRALLLATLGGTWDGPWGGAVTQGCSWGGVLGGVVVNVATRATSILLRLCWYRGLSVSNLCRLIRSRVWFLPVNLVAAARCSSTVVLSFKIEHRLLLNREYKEYV